MERKNFMTGQRFGYPVGDWDATKEMARGILRSRERLPDPTIAYSELGTSLLPISFQPDSRAFHEMLGEISSEEDAAGHGMLSVLVVHKNGDKMPGPGFFNLAKERGRDVADRTRVWVQEFKRVVATTGTPMPPSQPYRRFPGMSGRPPIAPSIEPWPKSLTRSPRTIKANPRASAVVGTRSIHSPDWTYAKTRFMAIEVTLDTTPPATRGARCARPGPCP